MLEGMGEQSWVAAPVCLPQLFVYHKIWTFPGMLQAAVRGIFSIQKIYDFHQVQLKKKTTPKQPNQTKYKSKKQSHALTKP